MTSLTRTTQSENIGSVTENARITWPFLPTQYARAVTLPEDAVVVLTLWAATYHARPPIAHNIWVLVSINKVVNVCWPRFVLWPLSAETEGLAKLYARHLPKSPLLTDITVFVEGMGWYKGCHPTVAS